MVAYGCVRLFQGKGAVVFILVIIINTMYMSSIDHQEYNLKANCVAAMERVKIKLPQAEVYCEEK